MKRRLTQRTFATGSAGAMYRTVRFVMGIVIAASPSGCMMAGGMGGMGGMSSTPPQGRTDVIGEARSPTLHVTLRVPAATAGDHAAITVIVRDAADEQPVSGARVTVLIRPPGEDAARPVVVQSAESAPGIYEAAYHFTTGGSHSLTAEVRAGAAETGAVSVSVLQYVTAATHPAQGRQRRLPLAVVGGAIMAAMMVVMIAS